MRKHNGMKSQDIAILLYIAIYCDKEYKVKKLSESLKISLSEISESLNRSRIAKLISSNKKVYRNALYDFIINGLKYVFPIEPGAVVRGIATSHSASPLNDLIVSNNEHYVWNDINGNMKGMQVKPLYEKITEVYQDHNELYEALTLVDAIRIGRVREQNIARDLLKKILLENASKLELTIHDLLTEGLLEDESIKNMSILELINKGLIRELLSKQDISKLIRSGLIKMPPLNMRGLPKMSPLNLKISKLIESGLIKLPPLNQHLPKLKRPPSKDVF